jgi:signal peptidase I
MNGRRKSAVKLLGTIIVAAAAWFTLAPTAIGGFDSYVVTDGTSMLPGIHGGGLVITRKAPSYHVGEVVAYHNAALKNMVVLHRIVAINDGHYTFKGDNNKEADTVSPTKSALVGRKWFYWPNGGRFVLNIRTPYIGAIILALFGMWAFADLAQSPPTPRHRRRHAH